MSVQDRNAKVMAVQESLERDMELLCVTGVEDQLQDGVRSTLELLRNAGIKVRGLILINVYLLLDREIPSHKREEAEFLSSFSSH